MTTEQLYEVQKAITAIMNSNCTNPNYFYTGENKDWLTWTKPKNVNHIRYLFVQLPLVIAEILEARKDEMDIYISEVTTRLTYTLHIQDTPTTFTQVNSYEQSDVPHLLIRRFTLNRFNETPPDTE